MKHFEKHRVKSKYLRCTSRFDLSAEDTALCLLGSFHLAGRHPNEIPADANMIADIVVGALALYGLQGVTMAAQEIDIPQDQLESLITFLKTAFNIHETDPRP